MEADFWHQMWEQPQQGFHQPHPNAFLQEHWQTLGLSGHETVLVPLCGKSIDMLWLAQQGHQVLGVELSEKALAAFVDEHNLTAHSIEHTHFVGYQTPEITLLVGDFFKLSSKDCTEVTAFYDRAALVALPSEMRQQYVAHLTALCPEDSKGLLVVMDYDQTAMSGPPFAVSDAEIEQLLSSDFDLQKLASESFERKGVKVMESAFACRRKTR